MAQPQAYNREVDFTERDGDDTNHAGINAELDAAALSINEIRDNLALIQRDDGGLQNGIVTAESLAPSAFDAVLANVNEAVQDAQTAANSATLAATTAIDARDDAQAAETAAETAATAASLNATTAVTKAAEAAASATSAATSASTATTKASEASTSATAAAGSATTATTKASEASTSAAAALASQNAAATSATNAAASASSALASLNDFKGRYYGPLASDPTQDPLGNAPTAGDLYFNTGTNRLRVFNATTSTWNEGNAGSVAVQNFSGNGSQTAFALAAAPESENNTQVYISGVYQQKTEYSISGTTLTFSSAPPAGTNNIEVVTMNTLPLGVTSDDLVQTAPEPGGLWSTVRGFITWMKGRWDALTSSAGASLVGFIQAGIGAVARWIQDKLRETVSVKDFGAVGDGVADDTAAIQAAIDAHRGKILIPTGTYKISSTIILKSETLLIGEGAGAYFQGPGYPRLTVLKPTASFTGTDILRADPADDGPTASYRYGVALRDMLIDCINIKNLSKTIIKLNSVSNSETFDSLRIINNNVPIAIRIGISANAPALESDGLSFNNIYCLQCDVGGTTTNPVLLIESGNEISFRDSKFQRGASEATVSSKAVHINAVSGRAVNAVTFDSCAFTGAESGLLVQGKNTDGQGPRWIRVQNCTFEGPKFPISAVGESTRPVQFCTFGPGNRMISLTPGGAGIVLSANANNNTVFADEFTTVLFDTFSTANTLYGGNSFTDNGTSNIRLNRNGSALQVNNSYIDSWTTATPGSGWSNGSPSNRTSLSYRKDSFGRVHLQGYLSGGSWGYPNYIFTLPAGYRPPAGKTQELNATGNGVVVRITVLDTGEVFGIGSGTLLVLDGISFPTN